MIHNIRIKYTAIIALILGLCSCHTDLDTILNVEKEIDIRLTVNADIAYTRAVNSYDSAYGAIDYLQGASAADINKEDWSEVNLRYTLEVYDWVDTDAGQKYGTPIKERMVKIVDEYEPVFFDLRVVPDRKYRFVVFADFVPNDVTDATHRPTTTEQANIGFAHTIGETLADITIKEDAINKECTDAYFGTKDIVIENTTKVSITLKRPYGKMRVVATDLAEINLMVDPRAVKVEYTTPHPTMFNAVTGDVATIENTKTIFTSELFGTNSDMSKHLYTAGLDAKTTTTDSGKVKHSHMTLFTDYILATETQRSIQFTMSVYETYDFNKDEGLMIKSTSFNTEIPIARNFLTTVIGNVLTSGAEVKVFIDDNFAGETVVDNEGAIAAHYYATLAGALNDINSNTIGSGASSDNSNAQVVVYNDGGLLRCRLLADVYNMSATIDNECLIELNGHTITSEEDKPLFNITKSCKIVGGQLNGVAKGAGTRISPYTFINVEAGAQLEMSECTTSVNDDNGGTISAIMVAEGGSAKITNSDVTITSKSGLMSNCVYNYGECTLEDSRLIALSNHCANAAGNDYGQTARAVYAENNSTTTFKDCYIYGAHSGATIRGKLYVDGGTYYGYSHGGLYVSNAGQECRILNATISECELATGYIDDGVAGTNHAGMYIGGSSYMAVYVDNCDFYGLQQPIVLRGSSGEAHNILYISNSRINLDYTHYGVRNDGSNEIKIGRGNNFGADDLKYRRNYELTDEEYK